MNVIDKLRERLDTAGIPYESHIEMNENILQPIECEADKYMRNQIIYGRDEETKFWKFDAIYQWGSFGRTENKVETYGPLGTDEEGEPMVMTAEEAFKIIADDFRNKGEKR
jgi:hypothetical protein